MNKHTALPRRWLRHALHGERQVRRWLTPEALSRVQAAVADSERHHTGEIRVCVEAALPASALWQRQSARERAIALFGELGVWDTEANNGVLIYLLLAEHAIEIVADRGVVRRVEPQLWTHLVDDLRQAFRAGQQEQGLVAAVGAVDAVLRRHFPLAQGEANPNELPDRPVIR